MNFFFYIINIQIGQKMAKWPKHFTSGKQFQKGQMAILQWTENALKKLLPRDKRLENPISIFATYKYIFETKLMCCYCLVCTACYCYGFE